MKEKQQPGKRMPTERLYALFLYLYPRAHQQAYGPLMLQTFKDSYRDELTTQGNLCMQRRKSNK